MSESTEWPKRVDTGPGGLASLINIQNLLLQARRIQSQMLEEVHEQEPEGVVEPIEPIPVDEKPKTVACLEPKKPWFTVSLINDGPDDVRAIVNTETSRRHHTIRPGEAYNVVMNRGKIKDVLLSCDTGENANVRLVGSR